MIKNYMRGLILILMIFVLYFFPYQLLNAQLTIGEWRTHLPYSQAIYVTEAGDRIFCATRSGLFYYNKEDNTLNKFTRINGLSDVEISCLNFSRENDILVIAYNNSNVDLIKGNTIYNIPDIKRKQITASKTINDIMFLGNNAYLSCGFGIVIINLDKMEIRDTYLIGENSSYKSVNSLAFDGQFLLAATDDGIYRADINSPNLIDFNYWHMITDIPNSNKSFNHIRFFNGKIYANYFDMNGADTLYTYDGSRWSLFSIVGFNRTRSIEVSNNWLVTTNLWFTDVFNDDEKRVRHFPSARPFHGIMDKDNNLWIADESEGLILNRESSEKEIFVPNGPITNGAMTLLYADNKIYVAAGGDRRSWQNLWAHAEVNIFDNGVWSGLREINYKDIISLAVDPDNSNHIFAGSWGYGLLEIQDLQIIKVYTDANSTLQNILSSGPYVRLGGMAYDRDKNLWITNSEVPEPISVRKPDGSWKSYDFDRQISGIRIGSIMITSANQKWVQLVGNKGLFVFDVNGTLDNEDDDLYRKLDVVDVNNKVITNNVFSFAEDRNGNIWLGTDKGIVVYYNPYRVFESGIFYGQQIIVPRNDGTDLADILLGTETVTAIAVDGANRKWVGTARAGVFLFSEDGIVQIYNFTKENSPMLSNNIQDIAIDEKTGEVFFGTDLGIVSYKSTATEPNDNFTNVYVYPNPVREDYDGEIVIKGMIGEANIKITDISGNIVYETTSLGGQALWDGRNFDGRKVATGIYLIFCTNEDGSKTYITKLLVIN
jgi:TSS9, PorZ, N-terminal beta-propeller domain/Two component regulator propeller